MSDALDRAHAYLAANRPAEAARAAGEAVAEDPDDSDAFRTLALALYRSDDYHGGLAAARRACALDPSDALAHRLRAMCHLERGEHWLARPAIEEALRLDPHAPGAYAVLSDVEIVSGDGDKAREAAERVLALDPHGTLGHFQIGRVALATSRDADAAAAFERVLARDPHDTAAMHNLAMARGDTIESTHLLAQVIRLDPRSTLTVRELEKRMWGTVVVWAVATWFLFFLTMSATHETMPREPAVALRALVPVFTTAWFLRELHRLPEGLRRHLTSRLRRLVPAWRWALPTGAVTAVGIAVPTTRPLVVLAAVLAAVVAWFRRDLAAERRAYERHRAVAGPVEPESFAPTGLRVEAAIVDGIVLALLGIFTGPLGAVALSALARAAGSEHGVWLVLGSVTALVATAVGHRLVATRRHGATFGQRHATVAVVDIWTGEALDASTLLRRMGWWVVSWLMLGAGFFPAWRGKPTLADRKTHSAVVRRGRPTV